MKQKLARHRLALVGLVGIGGLGAGALTYLGTGNWWLSILALLAGLLVMRIWWLLELRTVSPRAFASLRNSLKNMPADLKDMRSKTGDAAAATQRMATSLDLLTLEVSDLNLQVRADAADPQ